MLRRAVAYSVSATKPPQRMYSPVQKANMHICTNAWVLASAFFKAPYLPPSLPRSRYHPTRILLPITVIPTPSVIQGVVSIAPSASAFSKFSKIKISSYPFPHTSYRALHPLVSYVLSFFLSHLGVGERLLQGRLAVVERLDHREDELPDLRPH